MQGQDENSFFRYVWRFNALAIALVAIGAILLGSYVAISIFMDKTRVRRDVDAIRVGENVEVSEQFFLESSEVIAGASFVQVPLRRGQGYRYPGGSSYYYPKGTDQIVNHLFLNIATNESRWLFASANQLILQSQPVFSKFKDTPEFSRFRDPPDEPRKAVGFLYVVVDKDSNGDGRLSERDSVSLATSAVDGTGYRKLVDGIEQVYSARQVADDRVLVLYQKNQQTISELYSVPAMLPLKQANLPKVGLN